MRKTEIIREITRQNLIQFAAPTTFRIMRILYGSVESPPTKEEDQEASASYSSPSSQVDTSRSKSDPRGVAYRVGMNSLYREGQSQTFYDENAMVVGKSASIKSKEQSRTTLKVASAAGLCFSLALLLFVSGMLPSHSPEGMKTEKLIEKRPSSGTMIAPSSSSSSSSRAACPLTSTASSSCTWNTMTFLVEADPSGQWPEGFSWTLLKDSNGDKARKSVIFTTNGEDAAKSYAHVYCKSFDTELCLSGKYLVYANSVNLDSVSAVKVCNSVVLSGEALDFDADGDRCKQVTNGVSVGDNIELQSSQNTVGLECYIFGFLCYDTSGNLVLSRSSFSSATQQPTLRTPEMHSTTSSSERWLGVDLNDQHQKVKCTLFGLYCKPVNESTYKPTYEPTMMPTYSDSHWNQTTVVQCHFFGLW